MHHSLRLMLKLCALTVNALSYYCRAPGVSVSLTGELFDNLCAGQTVVLRAAVSKVGANLGFTEMRVLNGSGELVARVKHIKYLNMGAM